MSNNNTLRYVTVAYICETAYRIGRIDFVFPEMDKEVLVDDLVYFYQHLYDTIPGDTLYLDALDIFIEEGKLDQAYRDWYDFYEQFIENL